MTGESHRIVIDPDVSRRGRPLDALELRAVQLAVLKRFDQHCNGRGIRYFLTYGTLLGALRQLWDRQTILSEPINGKAPDIGVNIDIFPVDNMPDSAAACERYMRAMSVLDRLVRARTGAPRTRAKAVHKAILRLISMDWFVVNWERAARRYNHQQTEKVGVLLGHGRWELGRSASDSSRWVEFGGERLPVPADAELFLSRVYGDWCTPPLATSQVSAHVSSAHWR